MCMDKRKGKERTEPQGIIDFPGKDLKSFEHDCSFHRCTLFAIREPVFDQYFKLTELFVSIFDICNICYFQ